MSIFQLGEFTLNSGNKSKWKLECDALTDDDIAAIAEMIQHMVGPFCCVSGVPCGGLRLAAALHPHVSVQGPILIVDDVLTTGGSMERHASTIYHELPLAGAVIFARGPCPNWIKPLFQIHESMWLKGAS